MARNLHLQVLLQAVDRATAPLKRIREGSGGTARALRASRDELRQLEQTQRNLRGFSEMRRQLPQTARALQDKQRRVAELTREIRNTSGPTRQLERQRAAAIRQARELKQRYQDEQRQLHQLRGSVQNAAGLTGTLSDRQRQLSQRMQEANRSIEQQKARLAQLAQQQRRVDEARERRDASIARARSMAGTGARMVAAGSGILYAGSRIMAPGFDFDAAMSRVQALSRLERDDPRMAALRAQARELGAATTFSATEAAGAQGFLAMAGFDPESIRAAMPDMLALAQANEADLAQAADIASNILSGFGLEADQMGRLGDVLTATTTRANVNLNMLGETMKYVAPVARDLGVSIEESAAMAGLLGNVGIQGSQAGTVMREMLNRLTNQTGPAREAIQALGLEVRDAAGNLRPVPDILADAAHATRDLGSAERAEALQQIFGTRAGSGVAELIKQQGVEGITEFVDLLRGAAGENQRVASTMTDNVRGDLAALRSAWQELGIAVSETNDGPLRSLIHGITDTVRRIGNWTAANPQLAATITRAVAVVAALTAAIGAILLVLSPLLIGLAMTRFGFAMLAIRGAGVVAALGRMAAVAIPALVKALAVLGKAVLAHPIVALIAAIAVGAIWIWRNWEEIGPKMAELWDYLRELASSFLDWFRDRFEALMGWFLDMPGRWREIGGDMVDGIGQGIRDKLGELRESVQGAASSAAGWFKERLGIRSPSRVFAEAGRDTMAGYELGLARSEQEPLRQLTRFSRRLRQTAAGLTLSAATALPAAAGVQFDTRAPIAAATVATAPAAGDTITIHVHAAPGMSEAEIARQVERLLAKRDREKAARRRSALYDTE
ncbi:MAG: phage tail tape measure protein [Ectothiorhodospiraceae bacterium]|nr:phage tail tape measure protein [Ectothiorhodospiraceae bacterium]